MTPEEYAALIAEGKVILTRDLEENYIYDANKRTTGVLPRDIIEVLEKAKEEAIATHQKRMDMFDAFILALKEAR